MGKKKSVGLTPEQLCHLWAVYPKKVGYKAAAVAMQKAFKDGATFVGLRDGLLAYVAHLKRNNIERQFTLNPTTFFNQGHWYDEYPDTTTPGRVQSSGDEYDSL